MSLYELIFGFTAETRAKFPWVFEKGEIDRHKCERVVPMEVLSLGMGMKNVLPLRTPHTNMHFHQAEQVQHQCKKRSKH